jgi:Spy/CpxP family protein refolding chaperone
MRAHPDVLKTKLGLNDGQVALVKKVRTNFLNKRITARAEIQKLRLQMRTLYESSDIPNEQKLLNLMRKMRGQRGRLTEERVKTHLRIMRVLTKEQRVQLRAKCMERGWGKGPRGKRWGPGRGPGAKRGGGPGGGW